MVGKIKHDHLFVSFIAGITWIHNRMQRSQSIAKFFSIALKQNSYAAYECCSCCLVDSSIVRHALVLREWWNLSLCTVIKNNKSSPRRALSLREYFGRNFSSYPSLSTFLSPIYRRCTCTVCQLRIWFAAVRPSAEPHVAHDDAKLRRESSPIPMRNRLELEFGNGFTATGTSSHLLVINSRTLIPGNIYIVQLTVEHKGCVRLCGRAL